MRRSVLLLCASVLALSGCGMGKKQSPVGSDEELGRTRAVAEDEMPASYVTRQGDTLRSIAARPEIYGDAELWPLLLDANETDLGSISPGKRLSEGLLLEVPRTMSTDEMDEARERARQYAATTKSRSARAVKRPEAEPTVAPAAVETAEAQAPAPETAPQEAQPVPEAKSGGMMPVLLLLLLVLGALGAVLYVFSKRDKRDKV